MYAALKGVPKTVRREAYRKFIEAGPIPAGGAFAPNGEEQYWRRIGGNNYCPLGVVCLVMLGEEPVWTLPTCVADLAWGGPTEDDVERFIHRNDRGKFNTPEKLAKAMGVEA